MLIYQIVVFTRDRQYFGSRELIKAIFVVQDLLQFGMRIIDDPMVMFFLLIFGRRRMMNDILIKFS
jgi:hypothetical protein